MSEIRGYRELIHHCCKVNVRYMRLPAGELENYHNISSLYQRLADQSLLCAGAWFRNRPCPDHEPAVDAFWWAVVAWAKAFGISIGVDLVEWEEVFYRPHLMFADYLRHDSVTQATMEVGLDPHAGLPAETIMELDVRWMTLVMKLTARWGMFQHMKDMPALREAQVLERELRSPDGKVRDAYLRSDLQFFNALFEPFPFASQTRQQIKDWLALANPDNREWREKI